MNFKKYIFNSLAILSLVNLSILNVNAKPGDFLFYSFKKYANNKDEISYELNLKCTQCHSKLVSYTNCPGSCDETGCFTLWDPDEKGLKKPENDKEILDNGVYCTKCLKSRLIKPIQLAVLKCDDYGCPQSGSNNIIDWFNNNPKYIHYLPTEYICSSKYDNIISLSQICPNCEKPLVPLSNGMALTQFKLDNTGEKKGHGRFFHAKCPNYLIPQKKVICGCSHVYIPKHSDKFYRHINLEDLIHMAFDKNNSCNDICIIS